MCYIINYKNQTDKIAIALWIYHTDQWDEFVKLLLPISKYIKVYLGLCLENNNSNILQDSRLQEFEYILTFHNNFGADVAPFLEQLKFIREKYFIKLHSKNSKFGFKNHINWRILLLYNLIGSKQIFLNNIQILKKQNIGLITNKGCLLEKQERNNNNQINYLCKILNLNFDLLTNGIFPAGNMFMSKTEIYQDLLYTKLDNLLSLLKNEKGKISDHNYGTYTHALERIFGYIIKNNNLKFESTKIPYIKIYNNKSDTGFYKLVKLYNNDCYLEEDINVYGHIIDDNINYMTIKWNHTNPIPIIQKYLKKNDGNLISYHD